MGSSRIRTRWEKKCHKLTISLPNIMTPLAEPREDDSVSEEDLSGEDDGFMEPETTSPTIGLGFAQDIDEKNTANAVD